MLVKKSILVAQAEEVTGAFSMLEKNSILVAQVEEVTDKTFSM